MADSWKPHVVVIGSGLAGLTCALDLARQGVDVEVVTPGPAGRDGSSHRVHGLAPWIQLTAPWVKGDSPDSYLTSLKEHGEGLGRPGLAEVLAERSHVAAEELCSVLELEQVGLGPAMRVGENRPRGMRCLPIRHRPLLQPLVDACKQAGVRVREATLSVGLLLEQDRAAGVVAFDHSAGGLIEIPGDAVVLACGGPSAIFPVGTGPRWCVGSALAWAANAGILLHRPDLIQALPVTALPPRFFPGTALLLEGTVRADGRVLTPASNLEELTIRIAEAERMGEEITLRLNGLEIPPWAARLLAAASTGPTRLVIAAHHGIGGVAIDEWGRTSLAGLYACGEAAGGVQGRRRTMGTGLLEARIFGQRVAKVLHSDVETLGPSGETCVVLLPSVPARPAELSRALDAMLGPLVLARPKNEMAQALDTLASWKTTDRPADETWLAYLVGLRWQAAKAMLEFAVERNCSQSSSAPR